MFTGGLIANYKRGSRANRDEAFLDVDFLASDYCYGVEMKRAMERLEVFTKRFKS